MKIELSTKEAKTKFSAYTVVQAGYCKMQNLLFGLSPEYCTSGHYGWNCDIYVLGDVAVCTGHRGLFGMEDDEAPKYEARAKEIRDSSLSFDEKLEKLKELRNEYVKHLGGLGFDE